MGGGGSKAPDVCCDLNQVQNSFRKVLGVWGVLMCTVARCVGDVSELELSASGARLGLSGFIVRPGQGRLVQLCGFNRNCRKCRATAFTTSGPRPKLGLSKVEMLLLCSPPLSR